MAEEQAHIAGEHGAVRLDQVGTAPGGQAARKPSLLRVSVDEQTFGAAIERSQRTPLIFALTAGAPEGDPLVETLQRLVDQQRGRLLLAVVDAQAHPQIAQAFRIQVLPTTVAVIAGQPVPLFEGDVDERQAEQVFAQVLQVAQQQGVTETIPVPDEEEVEEAEPQLSPEHQAAEAALDAGDTETAGRLYQSILDSAPRDEIARHGLLQAQLLQRVAEAPHGDAVLDTVLDQADRLWLEGRIQDAFDVLLSPELWAELDDRPALQKRLIELFDLAGPAEPAVLTARQRLASLLF